MHALRGFLEADEIRKDALRKTAICELEKGNLPTPDNVRSIIDQFLGREREDILSHHLFWREYKLRQGLEALVYSAYAAYADVWRHDAALGPLSSWSEAFDAGVDHLVVHPSQKDVLAFCGATHGAIDTFRKIIKKRPDIKDELTSVLQYYIKNNVCAFIKDLRKNLSHGDVVIPGWNVTYDGSTSSGAMVLNIEDLLRVGSWDQHSKEYIYDFRNDGINVSIPVRDCFNILRSMYNDTLRIFARNISKAEWDYFDIEDEYKRRASRQYAKILVKQAGQGKNPYDYLHRFFQPKEVREILRRPAYSKEQVDFMITLKSVEFDVDYELREALYDIFEVPADER